MSLFGDIMTKYEILTAESIKTHLEKFSSRNHSELSKLAQNTASFDYVSGDLCDKNILKCLANSFKDYLECLGGINKSHGAIYMLARRIFVSNYLSKIGELKALAL